MISRAPAPSATRRSGRALSLLYVLKSQSLGASLSPHHQPPLAGSRFASSGVIQKLTFTAAASAWIFKPRLALSCLKPRPAWDGAEMPGSRRAKFLRDLQQQGSRKTVTQKRPRCTRSRSLSSRSSRTYRTPAAAATLSDNSPASIYVTSGCVARYRASIAAVSNQPPTLPPRSPHRTRGAAFD